MRIILKLKLHSPLVGTTQDELSIVFHYYHSMTRWLLRNKAASQIKSIISITEY